MQNVNFNVLYRLGHTGRSCNRVARYAQGESLAQAPLVADKRTETVSAAKAAGGFRDVRWIEDRGMDSRGTRRLPDSQRTRNGLAYLQPTYASLEDKWIGGYLRRADPRTNSRATPGLGNGRGV
jgi:hypothetical protein